MIIYAYINLDNYSFDPLVMIRFSQKYHELFILIKVNGYDKIIKDFGVFKKITFANRFWKW